RVRHEDPTGVGRRQLRGANGVAAIGDWAVGTRVGQDLGDGMRLDGGGDVGVGRPGVESAVGVDEIRGAYCHAGAFVGRLLQGDVEVQAATEVDDAEGQQQDHRGDQGELGHD